MKEEKKRRAKNVNHSSDQSSIARKLRIGSKQERDYPNSDSEVRPWITEILDECHNKNDCVEEQPNGLEVERDSK